VKFNETLELLTTGFEKFINTKTVVGEPFHIGDVALVPVITVTCGIGGGGGEGTASNEGKGAGGVGVGAGGGFRVQPVAILVVKGQEVTMMPITKKSGLLDKLVEMIPGLAAQMSAKMGKGKDKDDEACCECDDDEEPKSH
jgi:uncharacterized spore protein YtfJ